MRGNITRDLQQPAIAAFKIYIKTDSSERKLSFIQTAASTMHLVAFKKLILTHHVAKTMALAKSNNLCSKFVSFATWVLASIPNLCPAEHLITKCTKLVYYCCLCFNTTDM
jgi:hypothetical protein